MFVRLELSNLLLPVGVEDVAVVAIEALVDLAVLASLPATLVNEVSHILPRACKQLGIGSVALSGNLDQTSAN